MMIKVKCRGYEGVLISLEINHSILSVVFYDINIKIDKNTFININAVPANEIEFIEEKK